jgi:hypothetical protein
MWPIQPQLYLRCSYRDIKNFDVTAQNVVIF